MAQSILTKVYQKLTSIDSMLFDEFTLPEHIEAIARLPKPTEERYDLCFLHAAYQPIASMQEDISILFIPGDDDYKLSRANYMSTVFARKNQEQKNSELWIPLIAEGIGVLSDRRLYQDRYYQEEAIRTYKELLESSYLEKDALYRAKLRSLS